MLTPEVFNTHMPTALCHNFSRGSTLVVHIFIKPDVLLTLFSGVGEVKYVKVGNVPGCETNYGLIEFTDSGSIPYALQYNDFPLNGINIKTDYSLITIDKKLVYRRNRLDRSSSSEAYPHRRSGKSPEWVRTHQKDIEDRSRPKSPAEKSVEKRRHRERSKSLERSRKRRRDRRSKSRSREQIKERRSKDVDNHKSSSKRKDRSKRKSASLTPISP
ncbi:hypothetical protein RF11_13879 [Thelohanellus kitauei]|uniref:RRM domain-containing protein n=1 Tax=Thelohanellus kitauei TaxID=669202 RepID=A0A0C2JDK1_THEKT|nr:hypothetical protein RF11_13879 [Thelohanellus kitauei]